MFDEHNCCCKGRGRSGVQIWRYQADYVICNSERTLAGYCLHRNAPPTDPWTDRSSEPGLAVPSPQRIPTLRLSPMLGMRRCNGGPLAQVTAKGPAQPEPSLRSSSLALAAGETDLLCSAAAASRLKSQEGLLGVSPVMLPRLDCLNLALNCFSHLVLTLPHSPSTGPTPSTCFTSPPSIVCLSRFARLHIVLSIGAHDTHHLSSQSSDCTAKHGAGTAPQYPKSTISRYHCTQGTQTRGSNLARCGERPGSSTPFSPGLWIRVGNPPISNLPLPAPCRRVYSPFCL